MKYLFNNTKLYNYKMIASLFVIGMFTAFSCTKYDKLSSPAEGKVYMAQSYANRSELKLYTIDSPQTVYFGASIAGFNGAPEDITVDFEVDNSLITQFNEDYSYLNYHFIAMPDDAYTISGLNSTIKKGSSDSDPLEIKILASKLQDVLNDNVDYCIPVKIKTISAGSLDTNMSVAYFMLDSLYIRSHDITNHDTAGLATTYTFNYDDAPGRNDAGESAIHFVDSNYSTKYLLFTYHTDMYAQLEYPNPTVVNAYTLTSGNDSPQRDPKDWNLAASNDGKNWTVIDSRSNQIFPNRTQTIQFNTTNNTAYKYYRLNITANNDGNANLFQCTEWRLLQFY